MKDDSHLHSDESPGSRSRPLPPWPWSSLVLWGVNFHWAVILSYATATDHTNTSGFPWLLVSPCWSSYLPCSSRCCTRPGTCRSPQFSPAGSPPPGSSGWPGHGAQSVGTPGRPCLLQFAVRYAASETASARWAGCPLPSAPHPAHVPCERTQGLEPQLEDWKDS